MSDDVLVDSNAAASTLAEPASAGAMLRRAREATGLHVAALAVSMKVPVKKLEALEADRFDLLPDAVFVRALAASVCRTLKIDSAPILQKLPQTSAPKLDTEERGINAPFQSSGSVKFRGVTDLLARPPVLWVLALLVGVLVVVFFPESRVAPVTANAPANPPLMAPVQEPAPEAIKEPAAAQALPTAPSQLAIAPAPAAAASVAVNSPVAAPALAPVTAAVVVPPAPVLVAPPATSASAVQPLTAPPANSGIVALKAKGSTWVEVTDAKGVVQVRKTLAAGEVAYASGTLPLAVVVGRVDMTQVEVRGQAFSLDAISKDNVARFEVK